MAAMVRTYGHTMPPVGAYSAAVTSCAICGSSCKSLSRPTISSPSTPFSRPRSDSASSPASSPLRATTSEPHRAKGTPSSQQTPSIAALPATLYFAFRVPGNASKPACTIPLFAFDAPAATSSAAVKPYLIPLHIFPWHGAGVAVCSKNHPQKPAQASAGVHSLRKTLLTEGIYTAR